MGIQVFRAKLSEKEVFNERYCLVHFELIEPHRIAFQAGQHILMTVPGVEQKKDYSICSVPEMDHAVELLVDLKPMGEGSSYLQGLSPGDEVEFRAPAGQFVVDGGGKAKRLVFVATGSGISPIRSMILDLLGSKGEKREVVLYWGLRNVEDMFWEEEFLQLSEEFPNFKVEIILSQPPDEWKLSKGRVTDLVKVYEEKMAETAYYVCGNKQMIEEVSGLLRGFGVDEERIHFEKFY